MQEQQPKRPISELKPAELRTIVGDIQQLLWLDTDQRRIKPGGTPEDAAFWNGDKELSYDTLDYIAAVLDEHGLRPIDPPTVTGFKAVDEFTQHIAENFSLPEEPTPEDDDDDDTDDEIEPS